MDVKNLLKKYGYDLSYSMNDNLCAKALKKHLGNAKFNEFWNYVTELEEAETEEKDFEVRIREYIGNDIKHLKILLSGQIIISVKLIQSIIKSIKTINLNDTLRILELGGSDGWAAEFVYKSIQVNPIIEVVDLNQLGGSSKENIKLINSNYNDFTSVNKYDIVYSVLGSSYKDIDILLNCINRNIATGGYVYLGLRIQPYDYEDFIKKLEDNGFQKQEEHLEIVKVAKDTGTEYLPLFKFKSKSLPVDN
jgi:hypothetical protein